VASSLRGLPPLARRAVQAAHVEYRPLRMWALDRRSVLWAWYVLVSSHNGWSKRAFLCKGPPESDWRPLQSRGVHPPSVLRVRISLNAGNGSYYFSPTEDFGSCRLSYSCAAGGPYPVARRAASIICPVFTIPVLNVGQDPLPAANYLADVFRSPVACLPPRLLQRLFVLLVEPEPASAIKPS
jgi:hypothetical protein